MKSKYTWILFGVILLIAFLLRFYKLGEIPNGLYQDETAIGYNAYSILTTGRDEHSSPYPLYFKSFGDWKLPVYIYLTAGSVRLFGLNGFSVRFPSALFGVLSIIVLYFYIRAITKNPTLALLASGLLAINPWHVFYSRATFEVSVALFFFLVGGLFLDLSLNNRKKGAFIVSVLSFLIAFWSYNLTRLLAPMLFILLFLQYRKHLNYLSKIEIGLTLAFSSIILFPFFISLGQSGGSASATGTLIGTSASVQAKLLEFRSYLIELPAPIIKLLFNKWALTGWQYLTNIASYLSVPFFFLTGSDHGNHGIGTSGLFYLFELPFLLIGSMSLIRQKLPWSLHLGTWALATVAVASLTRESPHATRSFFLTIPVETIVAWGLLTTISYWRSLKKTPLSYILAFALCVVFVWNIAHYYTSYFVRFPIAYAPSWRSADKDLSLFIAGAQHNYEKVIFDKKAGFMYTSLLFYASYPPKEFQETATYAPDDTEGFSELLSFGTYEFREIDWHKDLTPGTLIITAPHQVPTTESLMRTFSYPRRPIVLALKQSIAQYPVEEVAYAAVTASFGR
ncbi:MAG: glycosyltransferase family 39 protein [Patescibacteria group bacterium]